MESKPRRLWRILRWVLIPVLLLAVLIVLAPWILSTDAVREGIVEGINQAIPGRVSAESVRFRWTAGQTLENLELHDPAGNVVLRVEQVLLEASLIRMLFGWLDFGTVRVLGLKADLERDENGELNLARAVAVEKEAEAREEDKRHAEELPPELRLRLELIEAAVTYHEPGLDEPIVVDPLDATFFVTGSGDPWTAEIRGREQSRGVSVTLDASLRSLAEPHVQGRFEATFAETARELRGLLGQTVVVNFEAGRSEIDVQANSERLALKGRFQPEPELALAEPLTLRWSPDPAPFYPDAEFPSEVRLDLVVNELRVPLDRVEELTVDGSCTLSDGVARILVAGEMQEIAWRDWVIRAKAAPLGTEVQAMLEGKLRSGGDSGTVALDARATDLLDRERTRVDGTLRVRDFPIDALDRILSGVTGKRGLLTDLLGDRLEVEAKSLTSPDRVVHVELGARSPRLRLVAPVKIDLNKSRVSAEDLTAWLTLPEGLVPSVPLEGETSVKLTVERLDAPLAGFDPVSSGLEAKLTVDSLRARGEMGSLSVSAQKEAGRNEFKGSATLVIGKGFAHVGGTLVEPVWNADGSLSAETLAGAVSIHLQSLPLDAVDRFAGLEGLLVDSCGPTLSGKIDALSADSRTRLDANLTAARFRADAKGSMDADRRVSLDASSSFTLTPALAERFGLELSTPVRAEARAPELSFALPFEQESLRGQVQLSAPPFGVNRVLVRDLQAGVDLDAEGAKATLDCNAKSLEERLSDALGGVARIQATGTRKWGSEDISGKAQLTSNLVQFGFDAKLAGDGALDLEGKGGVRMWKEEEFRPASVTLRHSPDGAASVNAKFDAFPPAIIDGRLAELFGNHVALQVEATDPTDIRFSARSTVLDVAAELAVEGETIRLKKPAKARWSLTPRSWGALVGDAQSGYRLGGPAEVALEVKRFVMAPEHAVAVQASADIERLVLAERESGARATLRALSLGIEADDLRKPAVIAFTATVEDDQKPGMIKGRLQLYAWDEKEQKVRVDPTALSFDSSMVLEDIPVAPLDRALGLEQRGLAVLGDRFTAQSESRMRGGRGTVDFNIVSGNAKGSVALQVDRKVARLAKPIDAQIEFNDRMASIVLPELGPLFKGVESTEEPIKLRIEKRGFALPLDRFDIRRLTIPEARIDIGKVVLNNLWLMDTVQQVVRARLPDNRTSTWFTPLELEMRGGVIRYRSRLDLLTQQSMHLSSWGSVDLGRNRLDLRVAFMTDSLRKHLGVKKARDGDTLQLPIHGSLDNPKVEFKAALAGLAKIRAEAEAADKIKEKWARMLIEAALEGLLKETLRASPVPEPSVDPLPWAARR